jgi:8-oxo-dGTP pyrophosphatase MutT (NUDIX family)
LLTNPERTGVLLQKRSPFVHQGGCWSVPGGALVPGEDPTTAALREAAEETGLDLDEVTVFDVVPGTVHDEWRYDYVLAETSRPDEEAAGNWEAELTRWISLAEVADLPLHPGLAADWPTLVERMAVGLLGGAP